MDFLPADQPIATCIATSCEDCPLNRVDEATRRAFRARNPALKQQTP